VGKTKAINQHFLCCSILRTRTCWLYRELSNKAQKIWVTPQPQKKRIDCIRNKIRVFTFKYNSRCCALYSHKKCIFNYSNSQFSPSIKLILAIFITKKIIDYIDNIINNIIKRIDFSLRTESSRRNKLNRSPMHFFFLEIYSKANVKYNCKCNNWLNMVTWNRENIWVSI